ncbi:predicted protein, partial [Nematostella vectensis]
LLLGYISISAIFGKLLCGRVADIKASLRLYFFAVSTLGMAVGNIGVTAATGYGGLVAYAVLFGFFDGCFCVLVPLLISDIVGRDLMCAAFGSFYGFVAIPTTLGPPISGLLYDKFESYTVAFLSAALPMIMGTLLL